MAGQILTAEVASFLGWWLIVPGTLGLLSGYQAVHTTFPYYSLDAVKKLGGFAYLLSRAVMPIGVYASWFFAHNPGYHSLLAAASAGLGTEIALRTQFYIKDAPSGTGQKAPIFKGLFDLVKWYQDLWLRRVGTQLADSRNSFVDGVVKGLADLPELARIVHKNANGWPLTQKREIESEVAKVEKTFDKNGRSNDKEYMHGLSFALLNLVGRDGVRTLLKR